MVANTQSHAADPAALRKLPVAVCAKFGFGFALGAFCKKIREVTGIDDVRKADAVGNTRVEGAAKKAS